MVNPNNVLFVMPNFDSATTMFTSWIQPAIDMAMNEGHNVIVLSGEGATRQNFIEYVNAYDPLLIVFIGHGIQSMITGQNKEEIVMTGDIETEELFRGRYAIFYSCNAGQVLIPNLINNHGLLGAISFNNVVFWIASPKFIELGENDPWLISFRKVFYSIIKTILTGGSMRDAYREMQNVTNEEINKYVKENKWGNYQVTYHLMKNRNMMNVYQKEF